MFTAENTDLHDISDDFFFNIYILCAISIIIIIMFNISKQFKCIFISVLI